MNRAISLFPIVKQVQAQTKEWQTISEYCVINDVATIQGVGCLLANVLSVVLRLLGLAGFVMIIYAAFNLLMSAGNSQKVEELKKTITFAVIGIIVALSAFIIVNLIANFTGVSLVKEFTIPSSEKNWVSPTPTPIP